MESEGNTLMKKYEVGRLLGQGAFAKVYHGRNLKSGQSVAIKVIDKEKVIKVGLISQIKREISIMGSIKHQNVIHLIEVMATRTKIYFVMEYAKGGELFHEVAKGRLKEDTARKYFQELISAVSLCHSKGIFHRDLKPENLLLDEDGVLKVSDFGLSALSESKHQDGLLHTTCGTPAYVAPEVIRRKGYDGAQADVWSCGVILYVLLAGYLPFHDSNIVEMYKKISRAEYKSPQWFPPEVRKLLSKILDPNPTTRISLNKIMENAWFKKGFDSKHAGIKIEDNEKPLSDIDVALKPATWDSVSETKQDQLPKPMNAFEIISLSTGFDLSGLFVTGDQRDEVQFTSTESSPAIVSKLEEIARCLKLKVAKKDQNYMRLEGCSYDRTDNVLSIDVEIFSIAPSYRLVEVKKSYGQAREFQKMLKYGIKPALHGIVWAWQGEEHH